MIHSDIRDNPRASVAFVHSPSYYYRVVQACKASKSGETAFAAVVLKDRRAWPMDCMERLVDYMERWTDCIAMLTGCTELGVGCTKRVAGYTGLAADCIGLVAGCTERLKDCTELLVDFECLLMDHMDWLMDCTELRLVVSVLHMADHQYSWALARTDVQRLRGL